MCLLLLHRRVPLDTVTRHGKRTGQEESPYPALKKEAQDDGTKDDNGGGYGGGHASGWGAREAGGRTID
jgi:hypothetical protein